MCGITGYTCGPGADASLEPLGVLQRMTAALVHRGPDADGYVHEAGVALGHRRLVILDRAGGRQPMTFAARGATIVFNGEIYNYRELNERLDKLGFHARTRSDTETILHAYAAWGEDCVDHLTGMFSFVILDRRTRRLFGARDRMGKKPLYYTHDGTFFAFASEPKALLHHPAVPRALDHDALARYLLFEHVPAPYCIFRGVRKLPAAHRFRFDLDTGRLAVDRWWRPAAALGGDDRPDADWIEQVRRGLETAVGRRLEADVPLGVFLSGGTDSAAITAAMARRLGGTDVRTFTIGFSDPRFDESDRARRLATQLGTTHHEQRLDPAAVLEALPAVGDVLDEPFADASILPMYLLAKFARQHVTVALGGDGGDELFAGYQTFRALRAARFYNALVPGPVHRRVVRPLAERLPARHGYFSLEFKIKRFLRGVKVPDHERLWRWLGAFEPDSLATLLTPEALHCVDPGPLLEPHDDPGPDPINRDCRVYTETYLAEGILTKVDRATMACSLETRSPLLDTALVELAAAIPGRLKVRRSGLKHVFRAAIADLVPAGILSGPKRGFAVPLGAWFRGALRDELLDTLDERSVREQGLFRPGAVRGLIEGHLSGRCDNRKALFTLFMFQRWRRRWLDHRPEPQPCARHSADICAAPTAAAT